MFIIVSVFLSSAVLGASIENEIPIKDEQNIVQREEESNNEVVNKDQIINELLIQENNKLRENLLRIHNKLSKKNAHEIPVLLYHHILSNNDIEAYGWKGNDCVVSLENFEEQMKFLHDNYYYTATLKEFEMYIDGKIQLPEKTVLITFDDGYLSNVVLAYNVMKKYGQRGVIFMGGISSEREKREFDPSGIQFISISEVHNYTDVFEYGCHTYNFHRIMNSKAIMLESSEEEIEEDLKKNKEIFNSPYIAYPFGKYTNSTLKVMDRLGYKLGFTVNHGYANKSSQKYSIPRVIIYPWTKMEGFKKLIKAK